VRIWCRPLIHISDILSIYWFAFISDLNQLKANEKNVLLAQHDNVALMAIAFTILFYHKIVIYYVNAFGLLISFVRI
jgi:hypothetical protein